MASDSGSSGAVAPVPDSNVDWVAFAPVTVNHISLKRKNVGGNGEDLVPNLVADGKPKTQTTISKFGGSTMSNYFYKLSTSYEEPGVVISIISVQEPVSSLLSKADVKSLERQAENDDVIGNN